MFKYLILAQCVVSFASDYLIDALRGPGVLFIPVQIVKILIDNGTHSLTALICWTSVLLQLTQKDERPTEFHERLSQLRSVMRQHVLELISALLIGSLLDADHFIAAGSPYLKAATNLQSRPFGHNLFFVFTVSIITFILLPRRLSLLFLTSTFSHLIRDALRRGFTLCPWSSLSSPSISYPVHLIMLACLPILPSFLLRKYPYYWDTKTSPLCFKIASRSLSVTSSFEELKLEV